MTVIGSSIHGLPGVADSEMAHEQLDELGERDQPGQLGKRDQLGQHAGWEAGHPLDLGEAPGGPGRVGALLHSLSESLTHSLDVACRGYLCWELVDCDPLTDPECSPAGKKLEFSERETRDGTRDGTAERTADRMAGSRPPTGRISRGGSS